MGKDRRLGLLGTVCLFATGCFSYGPYGHPGTFAPPNTAMASPPYGVAQVPPGAVWVPSSPVGSSTLTAPTPVGKSAPTTFDEGDHEPDGGQSVPQPTDPGKAQPQEATEPLGIKNDAKRERSDAKTSQRARPRPLVDEEFANSLNAGEPEEFAELNVTLAADDEPRLPKSRVTSAEFRTQIRSNAVTPAGAMNAEFGYDADNYSWLRGIIEFDAKRKVWHLIYSQSPDDNDQFGGEVTLKNPEHFRFLRSGQAVSVEGEFDPAQRDRLGKPVYEATQIVPVGTR